MAGDGARGLTDDVALFARHAVTTDTIVCGVHFLPDDPLDTVARKAVRVNVSDLVTKGCQPVAMTLASSWHEAASADNHATFARGLAGDLDRYGIALLGGDTTRLPPNLGPVFTVTMLGRPLGGRVPTRGGARAGHALFVTGTIGDAYLGLLHLRGEWDAGSEADAVIAAYRVPALPAKAADAVACHATASIDVSDGLLADAGHIAASSQVHATIEANAIPLSAAGRAWASATGALTDLVCGGDDYQALIAAPPDAANALAASGFVCIGRCEDGEGVTLIGAAGNDITPARIGYTHF